MGDDELIVVAESVSRQLMRSISGAISMNTRCPYADRSDLISWRQTQSDRRLIQECRHSRFGFPSTDTQRQSKADRHDQVLVQILSHHGTAENRLGPELIRRHAYDLTTHLAASHSRLHGSPSS